MKVKITQNNKFVAPVPVMVRKPVQFITPITTISDSALVKPVSKSGVIG